MKLVLKRRAYYKLLENINPGNFQSNTWYSDSNILSNWYGTEIKAESYRDNFIATHNHE